MRLLRWADRLAEYDFAVQYKPGSENVVADVLSRSPAKTNSTDESEPTEDIQTIFGSPTLSVISQKDLAAATSSDPILQEILKYTIEGWTKSCSNPALKRYHSIKDELSVLNGSCLYRGERAIIPPLRNRQ